MKSAAHKIASSHMDESSDEPPSAAPFIDASGNDAAVPRQPLLQSLRGWLRHALGQKDPSLKEALEEVIEEHEEQAEGRLAPEERVMLRNVLSFGDIEAGDIMVPRADIAAVPDDIALPELKRHIAEQRHTRIPVYHETLDHVRGFIHVKDLLPMLSGDRPFDLPAVTRQLLFVPPSMRIIDLLVRMRHAGSHMAVVVDEYGGTDGLVTMEDLFEEIVGDIQDEHDEDEGEESRVLRLRDGVFEASARIPIGKLEQALGATLATPEQREEFDTLGGLIFFMLGRIPARGETVRHDSGARFEILDADPRKIGRVRIVAA